ncbi:hypothetical protein UR09_05450 [Candidatus Nitromaritima sp. SCGC AAA799-A02]|nr:hypothetical protein UZ36_07210 [Candidatus Nitromaritima sp. SCGC AAA799-C22]KMP10703.1 hypothetical protein UR09_05450 [Candidatus Nitromaritima sp. SCGC AAA799-A02]
MQALFDEGSYVGELAQGLFPGGEAIRFEEGSFEEKIERTKKLIDSGIKTIYEATFQYDDILVMVDILHKGKGGWELYEVKASTQVKPVHENDVAVQYYVLNGSGIKLKKASLVHINNQYIRKGETDAKQLFTIVDLTGTAKGKQNFVEEELQKIRTGIKGGEPRINIGPHCSDPYECDFHEHCWAHIPETSIFNISRLGAERKWALYNDGILKFEDLPDNYSLNPKQSIQVEAELTGKEYVDKKAIKEFLDTIHYPLYFLDFETINPAVPPFDGIRPYRKIPFQYSLHFIEEKRGKLQHKEFLADEGKDPREKLARGLIEIIPEGSCVLAYNCGFEKGVIKELADQLPRYQNRLMHIHESIKDLIIPFRSKAYYKKEMNGSASLKYVLPALIPELSYDEMEISGGGQASSTYATLHLVENTKERKKIRSDLLEYCKLDTLGMVRILGKLGELV